MNEGEQRERLGKLVLAVAGLVVIAGMLARMRQLGASFDREFEGMQGAFFALAAVNYERLGLGAVSGYPVLNLDLPREAAPDGETRELRDRWYVYANHPPTVALLAWASVALLGPDDYVDDPGGSRIEPTLRLPSFVASVSFLIAFAWALHEAYGRRVALLGLAFAAAMPALVFYGTLVNYENPSLVAIAAALGFYARWLRTRARRDAILLLVAIAVGSATSYATAFFVAPIAAHAWLALGARRAGALAAALGAAALAPLALHAFWSARALAAIGQQPPGFVARARELLSPLIDDPSAIGGFALAQATRITSWCTPAASVLALVGLVCALVAWRSGDRSTRAPLGPIALVGAALYLLAFFRHTREEQHPFLMLVAPGVAACAAVACDVLVRWLLPRPTRPFAWIAIVAFFGSQAIARIRGLEDLHRVDREQAPLPIVAGAELARLVPPGSFTLYPRELGLNAAVNFYAWRTLWSIDGPDDTLPFAIAERYMPPGAARFVALPSDPPESARAATLALRARLDQAPIARGRSFEIWALP